MVPGSGGSPYDEIAADRRGSFVGSFVPTGVACRALACSISGPDVVMAGDRTSFQFRVRNRLPIGLSVECPTRRLWGWNVDGVPEAGVGDVDPPPGETTLAFAPRETRTFTIYWDGLLRERVDAGRRWSTATGSSDLTAHLAVNDWRARGTSASKTVRVVSPRS